MREMHSILMLNHLTHSYHYAKQ